jgi:hypothetical protein
MSRTLMLASVVALLATPAVAAPVTTSFTNFDNFTLGSVNGQFGWSSGGTNIDGLGSTFRPDQAVVNVEAGNNALRISNARGEAGFYEHVFSPRPGGTTPFTIPGTADPRSNIQPGNEGFYAGESGTGAAFGKFIAEFSIQTAVNRAQSGLSLSIGTSNGGDARLSSLFLQDTGTGISLSDGTLLNGTIGYGQLANIRIELTTLDGANNDIVEYFLNGQSIGTVSSFENIYRTNQAGSFRNNVVGVQSLLFRTSVDGPDALLGGGFLIDNVRISLDNPRAAVSEPASLALMGAGLLGLGVAARRKRRSA